MGRKLLHALLPPLLFLALLIALWELVLALEWVTESILPHPK
ncbi:MAG: ABC transporter permease, partial [Alphaproteobacteria bacterium]|nr:ABC transporter permease [Alphaproteobacteria bacterium]